jgi:uncharacterized protein
MNDFTTEEKKILLGVADQAIKYGLDFHQQLKINIANYPPKLCENGASFVTLKIGAMLRGCIGTLEAHQPLIIDVAHNAYSAAFCDPRFFPLTHEEYQKITYSISILSKPIPMSFTSEDDLLRQLRPKIDGLILSDAYHRGTFLPAVWESLPTPKLFLQHLKLKAGFPENYWSETLKIERYTTEEMR